MLFETSGEFFGVWERVKPSIQEGRKRFVNQQFVAHLEKEACRFETWIEDIVADGDNQLLHIVEDTAAEAVLSKIVKEPLHQVESRTAGLSAIG